MKKHLDLAIVADGFSCVILGISQQICCGCPFILDLSVLNLIEGHTRRLFGRRPKRRSSVHTGTFQGTGMRGVWPVVVWRLNVRRIYWKIRKSVLNCMKVVNGPIPGQSLHMRFPGSPPSPPLAHREIVAAGPLLHRISPPTA